MLWMAVSFSLYIQDSYYTTALRCIAHLTLQLEWNQNVNLFRRFGFRFFFSLFFSVVHVVLYEWVLVFIFVNACWHTLRMHNRSTHKQHTHSFAYFEPKEEPVQ